MFLHTLVLCTTASFRSPLLQSSLPGNVLFDPLRLSTLDVSITSPKGRARTSTEILDGYREAELKHGRLAMLAAVAYPVQETVNPILSKALHLPDALATAGLSPSLLNGNLSPATLVAFLGFASAVELYKLNRVSSPLPGDYAWRLTDAAEDTVDFYDLMAGEVWNGRIAMMAVLGYVVQEALLKVPVLQF